MFNPFRVGTVYSPYSPGVCTPGSYGVTCQFLFPALVSAGCFDAVLSFQVTCFSSPFQPVKGTGCRASAAATIDQSPIRALYKPHDNGSVGSALSLITRILVSHTAQPGRGFSFYVSRAPRHPVPFTDCVHFYSVFLLAPISPESLRGQGRPWPPLGAWP